MDRTQFSEVCRLSGLREVGRFPTKQGHILIGESFRNEHPFDPDLGPHWRVLYAVDRGKVDMAQELLFTGLEHGYLAPLAMPQHLRVAEAVKVANRWIGDNLEAGRYDG